MRDTKAPPTEYQRRQTGSKGQELREGDPLQLVWPGKLVAGSVYKLQFEVKGQDLVFCSGRWSS